MFHCFLRLAAMGTLTTDSLGQSSSVHGRFSVEIAADSAAPDGDGRFNLLEYALSGTNPLVAEGSIPIPAKIVASGSDGFLNVFVNVNATASDVALAVEFAPTPSGPWSVVSTYTTNPDGRRVYIDTTSVSAGTSRFYRIVVTPQ